ncbi:MAG TPA: AMP-binding protein [Mycobacterium sp.]|nr:AMP-binding protein [Mycobacterium sp.]HTX93842.1 AMP-binding protein [Mycobacterium sp.]
MAHDAETLCEAFQRTAEHYAEHVALRAHGGGAEITWAQYAARVEALAGGLAAAGVSAGSTVALMLSNRPEAVLVDTAAMHLGAIPFSIYNTSSPEQVEYLLGHAECRVAVTEAALAERILGVAERLPLLERVYVVDGPVAGAHDLAELELAGAADGFDFETGWRAVAPDDVATLIYTSGTTGPPKAVELTHRSLLDEARLVDRVTPAQPGGRVISYLPMAHLADRFVHYGCLVSGATSTFVADLTQVLAAVIEVRPTSWGAVPRVWEKLKAALEAGFAAEPDAERRAAVAQALETSLRVVRARQAGEEVPAALAEAHAEADRRVFAALRGQLGLDQVEYLISGAAPIAPEVLEFFAAIGLPICEVWGMSELSLIATINPPDAIRIGTVGPALPGVELMLAGDGELLVRGPIVMRGYRGAPELTAETIDEDGWLHTGDIIEVDAHGYLRVVDRKKELIINAAGKNMSPANIENTILAACPMIGVMITIGDGRPYNAALMVFDADSVGPYAAQRGLLDASPAALAADPEIIAQVAAAVAAGNARLSRVEQIKRFRILPTVWEPGGDEITLTMKLKRRPIIAKYATEIEELYAPELHPEVHEPSASATVQPA